MSEPGRPLRLLGMTTNQEFVLKRAEWYAEANDEPLIPTRSRPSGIPVDFWRVGRNASHSFYLGLDALGNLWRAACGESYRKGWDPESGEPCGYEGLVDGHSCQQPDIHYTGHA